MKKIIVFLSLLILGVSCSTQKEKGFDKFPKEYYLENILVKTPPVQSMIGEIVLLDSILVAMDLKGENIFHIFKFPEFDFLGSYIKRGRGPNEEVFVNPYFQGVKENIFMYQNSTSIKIVEFDLYAKKILFEQRISLPGELMNLQSPFIINDLIVGWEPFEESNKEFLCFNPVTSTIDTFGGENIEHNYDVSSSANGKYIFAKIISIKPDKSRFAVTYDKFPVLRIYKSDGTLQREVWYNNGQTCPKEMLKKKPSKRKLDKIMQDYRKLKSTNRYIYSLYIGKTTKELSLSSQGLDDFSNEIHVWDWNGKPIAKIILDKKYFSFEVTSDDKYLICSSLESMDSFFKYMLPWKN